MAITDLTPTSEIIGRTIISAQRGVFSMDLAKILIKSDNVLSEYLHFILNSRGFLGEARKYSVGNNVKHLALENVLSIQIPLPSIEEQEMLIMYIQQKQKEVKLLQSKIEKNKQTIDKKINHIWG